MQIFTFFVILIGSLLLGSGRSEVFTSNIIAAVGEGFRVGCK